MYCLGGGDLSYLRLIIPILILTGLAGAAFSKTLWQFYLAHGLQLLQSCKYGLVRSLLSKCVEKNETGKVFSTLAILSSVLPLVGIPVYCQFYNCTLNTFPPAEILLTSSILFITSIVNFMIYYTQKSRIEEFTIQCEKEEEINKVEEKDCQNGEN